MRLLRHVVHRGPAVVAAAGLAGLLAVTGCSRFDAALGQRQALVSFKTGTSLAQRLQVRAACSGLPGISVPKLPDLKKYPTALHQVTFTVTRASDADVARLTTCLSTFTSVAGVNFHSAADDG